MKKLFSLFFIFISISGMVSAFGPNTHVNIATEVLAEDWDSPIKEIIESDVDAFYTGILMPDITVIYYYSNFKKYEGTHNWDAGKRCLELASTTTEKSFCYGWLTHLAQDGISHNYFIPDAIRRTKLPNVLTHPMVELKIDALESTTLANHAFDRWEEFMPLVTKIMGQDFTQDAKILHAVVSEGTFYQEGFVWPTLGATWTVVRAIGKIVQPGLSIESSVAYRDLSKKTMREVLEGTIPVLDPSGAEALKKADKETNFLWYSFWTVALIAAYIYARRKRWI